MGFSAILCEAGVPTRHVYFPTRCYVCLTTKNKGNAGVEVGMVGREGMIGAHLALGVMKQPLHAVVQGEGDAMRVPARAFEQLLLVSPELQALVKKYLYFLMTQLSAAADCHRHHEVGPRLACWLLMSHERARSDRFHMTHEFISEMLGVRRVSVTIAAIGLQERGLIEYKRGAIHVVDPHGLKLAACSCYEIVNGSYASVLGKQ